MKTFKKLRNAQSITLAYDGLDAYPPMLCYLKPYFNDVNKSYFQQLAEERCVPHRVGAARGRDASAARNDLGCSVGASRFVRTLPLRLRGTDFLLQLLHRDGTAKVNASS